MDPSHNACQLEEEFICGICERLFNTGETLKVHLQIHTGQGTSLTFEAFNADSESSGQSHENKINVVIKEDPSDFQPYIVAPEQANYSDSLAAVDRGDFTVNMCEDLEDKQSYDKNESGKSFICKFCEKSFKSKSLLKEHTKTHANEKRFSCEFCEKNFKQKCYLKDHIRTHTGHKPFSCDQCDKAFTTRRLQQQHVRTHSGEKPFECPVCNKRFTKNQNLQHHARTHTGEKPYTCDICQKSFSQQSYLKIHVWKHSNTCDIDPFSS